MYFGLPKVTHLAQNGREPLEENWSVPSKQFCCQNTNSFSSCLCALSFSPGDLFYAIFVSEATLLDLKEKKRKKILCVRAGEFTFLMDFVIVETVTKLKKLVPGKNSPRSFPQENSASSAD